MAVFGSFLDKLAEFARNIGGTTTISGGPGLPTTTESTSFGMPRVQDFLRPVVQTPISNPYELPQGVFDSSVEAVGTPSGSVSDLISRFVTEDRPNLPQNLVTPTISAAQQYANIDPNILASLIAQETGGTGFETSEAVGPSGEVGITQITPEYFFREAGFPNEAVYAAALQSDPNFAIQEAARILSGLMEKYGGDIFSALASYNAGSTGFTEGGLGKDYAEEVLRRVGQ